MHPRSLHGTGVAISIKARMVTCLNCGTAQTGRRFCGECGQSAAVARLTWRDAVTHLRDQLFDGDLPWIRTLRELTFDPGGVARRFIQGHRIAYVHPLKYAFYTILISAITFGYADVEPIPGVTGWRHELATNLPVFLLLITPITVAALRLCFVRARVNSIETWVFVLYVIGHLSLFFSLHHLLTMGWRMIGPLGESGSLILGMSALFIPLVYFMVGATQFYSVRLYHALFGALVALVATTAAWVYLSLWLTGNL